MTEVREADPATPRSDTLRAVFAGRRGRLLAGLLLAEFAGAVQVVAYSSVLPLAARELDGHALYGPTLAAGTIATIVTLACGVSVRPARRALFTATALYLAGVALAVTAPAMALVLAGAVVRGVGGGLLAGFGLSAIGGLYEGDLRRRVMGLFAMMWLLPSLLGPTLTGAIASAAGWRVSIAWPALVVVAARVLIGRDVDLVPWHRERSFGSTLVAVRRHLGGVLALVGVSAAFFGGDGLISLAVIDGTGHGVLAGSLAVGAGLVGWSVAGWRPLRHDRTVPALIVLAVALGTISVAMATGAPAAFGVIVAAWACGGLAMGAAYPTLTSDPFDRLDRDRVAGLAAALALAELVGSALGGLAGGGAYSLGVTVGWSTPTAIAVAFAVLAILAVATVCVRR